MLVNTRPLDVDYAAEGLWEKRTLCSFLDQAAALHPERSAVKAAGDDISYHALRSAVASMAAILRGRWVNRHDVVTILLPNWLETVVAIHAASWAGCVVNPVVTTYRRAEVSFILEQSKSRAVFIPHVFRGFDFVEMLSEILAGMSDPPTVIVVRPQGELPDGFVSFDEIHGTGDGMDPCGDPSDICLLLYTSGTTSLPKGVLHNHQTITWEMRSIVEKFGLGDEDAIFMASPVGHLTGIVYGVYLPTLLGQSVTLLDIWDPVAAVDLIERDGCRVSLGATPFLHGLSGEYRTRDSSSSLRLFLCGGADMPADLIVEASQQLGALVTRTYGSSEMPTYSISGPESTLEERSTTDGTPLSPASGRLLDERDGIGELAVRGPELFLGYLDPTLNESAFTGDGYFKTGDLVSVDDSGAITVRGRVKDIIIRGGENISALEVENHLRQHAAIEDAAVVGYPDDKMGERVAAFLVLAEGVSKTDLEIGGYLRTRGLAAHKWPEKLRIVGELPHTASGKVHKQLLRQRLSQSG
ncbi:AMP-binding protein [Mycobacterium sp. CVI_P3]|uniref:AMP-binding protein n=1 Tax=Mycobacterium pinniadriaticum TaxID=2994102 RepID=A0ABT3SEZ2_9MYCO|nr:AMP-binding protein [Mycobacterium pinniadriaticum]MCX2931661.1 AMP-binding protein [Mycobacterium pinniadriaticum]MCX2937947.1 AMP-binding protein [Mycobacterium pinniadriaticum]